MQYKRNDIDFSARHLPRARRHDRCLPGRGSELALRIELFDDEIESCTLFDPLTGPRPPEDSAIHGLSGERTSSTPRDRVVRAVETIKEELR